MGNCMRRLQQRWSTDSSFSYYEEYHYYANIGDIANVQKFLRQKNFKIDKHVADRNTALSLAVHEDHLEVAKILLESGANVNNSDYEGDTSLHYAVANGNLEMVDILIAHGADVCARNVYQITPVWIAAYRNYPAILKLLLYNFANPKVCSFSLSHAYNVREFVTQELYEIHASPLYVAVARNSTECVNVLIQAGYEIHKEAWLLEGDYPPEKGNPRSLPGHCDAVSISSRFGGMPNEEFESLRRRNYDDDAHDIMFAKEESMSAKRESMFAKDESIFAKEYSRFAKAEKVKENIALLNGILTRPPTLLSLCRFFIRKHAGRKLLAGVSELGLPKHLERYLTLADFKTTFKNVCVNSDSLEHLKSPVAQNIT